MARNNYKECLYNNMCAQSFYITEKLSYQSMASSARYFFKKDNHSIEEAVEKAINRRIIARNKHIMIDLISHLREKRSYTSSYIILMCNRLKVSSKNMCYITKRGYDPRSAIIIIYYSTDKFNKKKEKTISTKWFNKIISDYELHRNNLAKLNFKTVMVLFCAGIINRNDVFTLLDDGFILGKARKLVRNKNMNYQLIEEIKSEITIAVIDIINSLLPYEKEQTYKYINLRLIPLMLLLSIKYKYRDISLDGPRFPGNSGNSKTLMDYITA